MVTIMKRAKAVCNCHAYAFPHRENSGVCCTEPGMPFCGCCGIACSTHQEDQGIGHFECHGQTGFDSNIVEVSDCCGAEVYDDPRDIPQKRRCA